MIEWDRIKQKNWMRIDWDELDNHIRWLTVIGLGAF